MLFAEDVELPSGRVVEGFYTIQAPDFALVVPVTRAGQVIAVRQYKHGAGRVSLALPAGYVEPGESPEMAARRELLEETGYATERWVALGGFVVDGNRGCGRAHLFLAGDVERVQAPSETDLEEGEVLVMEASEFRAAVSGGEVVLLPAAAAFALALASPQGAAYLKL
jgi:ADP-ribose pyrophosphatase